MEQILALEIAIKPRFDRVEKKNQYDDRRDLQN
jgi:hypothetical protein